MSNLSPVSAPSWPGLYNPSLEIGRRTFSLDPIPPGTVYLHDANGEFFRLFCFIPPIIQVDAFHIFLPSEGFLYYQDKTARLLTPSVFSDIFRFTLYWTLLFVVPPFLVCGLWSFTSFTLRSSPINPSIPNPKFNQRPSASTSMSTYPPQSTAHQSAYPSTESTGPNSDSSPLAYTQSPSQLLRKRRGRRLIGICSLLLFPLYGVGFSVLSSLAIGYGLALVYHLAGIEMSTWVPFLWGLIQGVVNILRWVCLMSGFEWADDSRYRSVWPPFLNLT
jgi:hypothetical protein